MSRLSELPIENQPTPTSYYLVIRDNGDGTFTDVKTPIKNSYFKELKVNAVQSGTAAPTVTELINTVGVVVWTRVSTGKYRATLAGAFTSGKTSVVFGHSDYTSQLSWQWIDANNLEFSTAVGGVLTDSLLKSSTIAITVYP